jgi:ATP-dependent Lon protease
LRNEELSNKVRRVFPGLTVNKEYSQSKEISKLPRFISEYLIAKNSDSDGTLSEDALKRISNFIYEYYPEHKDKEFIKYQAMHLGSVKVLDEFTVVTDVKYSTNNVLIPVMGLSDVRIKTGLLLEHENLLRGGMWGISKIVWDPETEPKIPNHPRNLLVEEFVPFQVSRCDLQNFIDKREGFTTDEWIEFLINTMGLNPNMYNKDSKLTLLSRVIPLVEPNVNMVELGPKGTGKTFLLRNISYYSRIISGGNVSPAVLFYHLVTKTPGLIAVKDLVVFDEISKIRFNNPDEVMGKLKDYMESGNYERGGQQVHADSSVVLVGNLPIRQGRPRDKILFEVLPEPMRDTAFLDRMHGFVPGWDLPRIQKSDVHLSQDFGLVGDYFCEILHRFRSLDFQTILSSRLDFSPEVELRDEKAILKTASGLIKLVYPTFMFSESELKEILDIAVEYRQMIVDQLHLMDPEFKDKQLSYSLR